MFRFLSLFLQLAVWKRFRELSIEDYERIYKRLNVSFDEYAGESQYVQGAHSITDLLDSKGKRHCDGEGQKKVCGHHVDPLFKFGKLWN